MTASTAVTRRRVAGTTALLILLSMLQGVLYAPTAGAGDIPTDGPLPNTCEKVEDQDLGVENLQITVDGHILVTFRNWVGSADEFSAVTVDVAGLLANESLVWQTKAGSPQSGNLETNSGVIPTDGTYTISRASTATKGISHITLCVVDSPEPNTARLTVEKKVVIVNGTPSTTVFAFEVTGQPGFTLVDGGKKSFTYQLNDTEGVEVTVTEVEIGEDGWVTSIACDGSTTNATFVLEDGDSVTCTVTNTYRAPTTTSSDPTTTQPTTGTTGTSPTTEDTNPVTTTAEAEVAGTTITAPAEVAPVTLPFTGSATGGLGMLGLIALIAGIALLRMTPKADVAGLAEAQVWSRL
jgi:hypothetical protein